MRAGVQGACWTPHLYLLPPSPNNRVNMMRCLSSTHLAQHLRHAVALAHQLLNLLVEH